jgi:hypothetical protein
VIGDRWGVREDEVSRHYPCDDLVLDPVLAAWRGVTVHANPAQAWLWIRQLQLAPYSYDWIDNRGRRSPQHLSDLADHYVGGQYSSSFGRPVGRVVAVEPGVGLTGKIMGAYMSYVLVPEGDQTRLLLKVVAGTGRIKAPLLCVGDLVMARRQLLNLKRLAERSA